MQHKTVEIFTFRTIRIIIYSPDIDVLNDLLHLHCTYYIGNATVDQPYTLALRIIYRQWYSWSDYGWEVRFCHIAFFYIGCSINNLNDDQLAIVLLLYDVLCGQREASCRRLPNLQITSSTSHQTTTSGQEQFIVVRILLHQVELTICHYGNRTCKCKCLSIYKIYNRVSNMTSLYSPLPTNSY